MSTIGTCSKCRGPVVLPDVWMGVQPPVPQCQRCHRIPNYPFGPLLEMQESTSGKTTISIQDLADAGKFWQQGLKGRT